MTIHVNTGTPYDVMIGSGLLANSGELIKQVLPKAERAVIVSDSIVAPLYADTVKASLEAAGYTVFSHVFPAGEQSKRLFFIDPGSYPNFYWNVTFPDPGHTFPSHIPPGPVSCSVQPSPVPF